MSARRWLAFCLAVAALVSSVGLAQANRPRKKMIAALAAIDVSSGSELIQQRASLPWALARVLVFEGVRTTYAELCAVSGWSALWLYGFDKISATRPTLVGSVWADCVARGLVQYGKRLDVFRWPSAGTEQDRALAARMAWEFTLEHIGAGRPVITDYLQGGVFYGYDETQPEPVVYFDTLGPGFGALRRSQFVDAYQKQLLTLGVVADDQPPPSPQAILVGTIINLLVRAYEPEADSCPAGLAAMAHLAADLLDPLRDWSEAAEWFSQGLVAAQGEARLCTAVYLRQSASLLSDEVRAPLLTAADHYEEAARLWRSLRNELSPPGAGQEITVSQRLAVTGRREALAGRVHQALGAELLALGQLRQTVDLLGKTNPAS